MWRLNREIQLQWAEAAAAYEILHIDWRLAYWHTEVKPAEQSATYGFKCNKKRVTEGRKDGWDQEDRRRPQAA